MNTFSVVATPIGNLQDITLRALDVLKNADLILCEDTRVTKKLLQRHGIQAKTMSYHTHSKLSRVEEIVGMLRNSQQTLLGGVAPLPSPRRAWRGGVKPARGIGRNLSPQASLNIVLLSDAGTPAISDPGSKLVRRIRSELAREIQSGDLKIEAIPGPSALTAALSIAGVSCAEFIFLGFLPHKKGRQTILKEIAESERTIVFYESPHRILKTLESLSKSEEESRESKVGSYKAEVLSQKSEVNSQKLETEGAILMENEHAKRITVCKELTKVFEEVVSGTAAEVSKYFSAHADKVRGEFVVIVSEERAE